MTTWLPPVPVIVTRPENVLSRTVPPGRERQRPVEVLGLARALVLVVPVIAIPVAVPVALGHRRRGKQKGEQQSESTEIRAFHRLSPRDATRDRPIAGDFSPTTSLSTRSGGQSRDLVIDL